MPLKHSVTEIKLKNGAQGLIIDTPGATVVSYEFSFRGGNNYARSKDIRQVAHIMEHLAFGTNKKFASQEEFSQEFTKNGAYNNAYTGSIDLGYVAEAPLMEWDRILDLQQLAITTPLYKQANLDAEKRNVYEELTGYANNNIRVLAEEVSKAVGLDRLYDPLELKSIKNVTLADIKEHFKRTHTLKNMRFVLTGDLKKHQHTITTMLESWDLPKGERLAIEHEAATAAPLVHKLKKDVPNLYFDLNFYVNRTMSWADLVAMATLNHILNGTFHSRIWGAARSRGIAYFSINSGVNADPSGVTDWVFRSQVGTENAKELFELIIEQLEDIVAHGPTTEELEMAEEFRLGNLQMAGQTVNGLTGWYDEEYFDRGEIAHMATMRKLITAVSVKQIQQLAQEFLTSGIWVFGGLGNITKAELQKHYDLFDDMVKKAVQ